MLLKYRFMMGIILTRKILLTACFIIVFSDIFYVLIHTFTYLYLHEAVEVFIYKYISQKDRSGMDIKNITKVFTPYNNNKIIQTYIERPWYLKKDDIDVSAKINEGNSPEQKLNIEEIDGDMKQEEKQEFKMQDDMNLEFLPSIMEMNRKRSYSDPSMLKLSPMHGYHTPSPYNTPLRNIPSMLSNTPVSPYDSPQRNRTTSVFVHVTPQQGQLDEDEEEFEEDEDEEDQGA